ncbi:MAG: tyrosine--tRNA ligase [bacterium]|nr:tyrosine--tRNA ligase [Candidatus Jorgensenbacteria bacterium]
MKKSVAGKTIVDKTKIEELLFRGVDTVYPTRDALRAVLLSGKRIRLYLGIDPTSPHLHLGHAENILMLRKFQDLGHEVILLMGDFTGRIGDPTDKLAARTQLTEKEVKENLKTFKKQASKILRFTGENAAKIKFNASWHSKLTFEEVIKLSAHFTVQQMLERSMFQERMKAGKPIGLHEFLYPLMQGYDSVVMDVDLEIGGTDQTFNMLAGRTLLKSMKGKEKFVITNRLLEDPTTGKKMSKTEGTLINLDDEPNDMFGKVMACPDELMLHIMELSTLMTATRIEELKNKLKKGENPRDIKLVVAKEVVSLYHSGKEADEAHAEWLRVFSKKERPEDAPKLKLKSKQISLLELVLATGVPSKSEARRLIEQNAVKINDAVKKDGNELVTLRPGDVIRIGKHRFFEIA